MRFAIALGVVALLTGACSSASPAPKDWQAVPGERNTWTNGSSTDRQEYSFDESTFSGGLKDLASRVAIDVLLRYRGAKLQGSVPFAACPGAAGVATFRLIGGATLEAAFAVRNDKAVVTRYLRPLGTPADPSVEEAMQTKLCAL